MSPANPSEKGGTPNVLILSSSFPRWKGDYAGAFVEDAARSLFARGVSTTVICPSDESGVPYQPEGMNVLRFAYFLPRHAQRVAYGGGMLHNLLRNPLALLQLPLFLASFLHASVKAAPRNDLIHANWIFPAGLIGALTSIISGKPLVITVRGSDVNSAGRNPLLRLIFRRVASFAQVLVCVSEELRGKLHLWGIPPDLVRSFPDGVDEYRGLGTREDIILFVGRLAPEKRVEDLIDAFGAFPDPGIRLAIAGNGPQFNELVDKVSSSGLANRVTFLGTVPRDSVPELLSRAAIFVLPSTSEGLPDSLLLAAACETPIIASRLPGVEEALERGRIGILVEPRSPEDISRSIAHLLSNRALSKKIGRLAKWSIQKRYQRDRMVKRQLGLYSLVTDSGKR